jgi:hypothetical protein
MSFTTETLDKAYLEYSNITSAKTAKELKLEQENKMMRDFISELGENIHSREVYLAFKKTLLSKLTKDER